MSLFDTLAARRKTVLDQWFDAIVKTYPGLSAVFLHKKHPFGNPVGTGISAALEGLYGELLAPEMGAGAAALVESIMRIRTVQDFTPAQAAAVFFLLKPVVHEVCAAEMAGGGLDDYLVLESRIDALALMAFEAHARIREQLFEMRIADFKQRFSGLLRRLNIVCELPGAGPGLGEETSQANLKRGKGQ
jgi:hypothetical protein